MIESIRAMLDRQFQAALRTMDLCIDQCPADSWDAPVAELKFCQVVFHALFFTDLHLNDGVKAMRAQDFHQRHPEYFRDYEELEDRPQTLLYDRPTTKAYVVHCHERAELVMSALTPESFAAPADFSAYPCSRGELYLYSLRHIQHHAAQLGLRLRLDTGQGVRWVKAGWQT